MSRYFDPDRWAAVPFHFWSLVFFAFGSIVGSFLNVCIHRMPLGQSVVSPPSHCPKCRYSIPWYLNMPLITWLWLRGRCAHCAEAISVRYFLVELLTGLAFLSCWLTYYQHPLVALVLCLVLAGFIVASFIDFEHFIIPDEITIGGMVAGFLCSFAVPALHQAPNAFEALQASAIGMAVGGGVVYGILRLGKLMFGRQELALEGESLVIFTDTALVLPNETIAYEELFYRNSDKIVLQASRVELIDRCYLNVPVRLSPVRLMIGSDRFDPEQTPHMEVVTDKIVVPREALGFGDVKFMAAIGAFLGWQATIFSLLVSSIIGALVGTGLIVMRRSEWSSRLPYGPYIALAAVIWIFSGLAIVDWIFSR